MFNTKMEVLFSIGSKYSRIRVSKSVLLGTQYHITINLWPVSISITLSSHTVALNIKIFRPFITITLGF